ncbi:MAG: hypothetical protein Q8K72_15110 [Acidimicrobiales bacterium]|nr:hypothetical protein [Acidimicrobiales bacterium]
MLAETVSIDGGTLLLILASLLVVAALSIAVVVFGFLLAPRAGRGSGRALGWWIVILALESFVSLGSVAAILAGDFSIFVLLPPATIAGQVALFLQARKDAGR